MRLLLKLRFDVLTKKETGRERRDSNPAGRGSPLAYGCSRRLDRVAMQERNLCSHGKRELPWTLTTA